LVGGPNAPAFQNSWVNFGGDYNTAGYFRDSLGIVHLRGLVKSGGNTKIFDLPDGYKPALRELHIVCTYNTAGNYDFGRLDITQAGEVTVVMLAINYVTMNANVVGFVTWLSLDGITFRAAQ
jgi:hypothetical protein